MKDVKKCSISAKPFLGVPDNKKISKTEQLSCWIKKWETTNYKTAFYVKRGEEKEVLK